MATGQDWRQIYSKRRESARNKVQAAGLDGLLVCGAANRFYLSGFELQDGQPGETAGRIYLGSDGTDWLATDSRFAEAAARLWDKEHIFIYGQNVAVEMASLLRQNGTLVGIESDAISWQELEKLKEACQNKPALVSCCGIVEGLRSIKEPLEVAALTESFGLNHKMFDWIGRKVAEQQLSGQDEARISWEIEKYWREHGAQGLAFPTIVASGRNSALPHAIPGSEEIGNNLPLLIDAGCRVANYCSDQTRSWWYGNHPTAEFTRALTLTQEAQKAAMGIMKPGVPCAEVYQAARKVFEQAGVASAFTHGLGHGVGLETHELPSLSPRSAAILKEGMVVTVEPGLYYPEWGGVRWEHTVVVEKDGIRVL